MITIDDLADCQADQLSAMWDRCIIREKDSWAGEVLTPGPVAWRYQAQDAIPCRVAPADNQATTIVAGDQDLTVTRLVVTLPVDVSPVTDQVITVTACVADPLLVGRRFDVTHSDFSTFLTARRTHCTEHR